MIDQPRIDAALRVIWLDLFRRGLLPDEVDNYRRSADWFPWLKTRPEIEACRPPQTDTAWIPCEPQIVVQPPDTEHVAVTLHYDQAPDGSRYALIAGVALTRQTRENGGLWFRDHLSEGIIQAPTLLPGDVLTFDGDTEHASGVNESGEPRIAVYYRWRQPTPPGNSGAIVATGTAISSVSAGWVGGNPGWPSHPATSPVIPQRHLQPV